jgi:nucleotide-binding universal stress UspA family protein
VFDNAVVGVRDCHGGRDALELASSLLSGGGELTVLYVEVVAGGPTYESRTGPAAYEARIAAEVARIQARSVGRGLHAFAASRSADLIVIGASGGRQLKHPLRGEDPREVLEDPPCAVAVAPVGYSARSEGGIRKIGVGYDASPESERALALARTIAAELGATLSAFEAVPPRLAPRDLGNPASRIEKDINAARRRIAALGDVEPHAELADDAVDALRSYGRSVDLLVLGPHQHRPPDRHLKRSKSQRLAQNPSSALLVLGSHGNRASARRALDTE